MKADEDKTLRVADAAHEVKNSLAALKGIAAYAAAGRLGPLDADDEAALAQLLAGVDQVLAVVQDLMENAEKQDAARRRKARRKVRAQSAANGEA